MLRLNYLRLLNYPRSAVSPDSQIFKDNILHLQHFLRGGVGPEQTLVNRSRCCGCSEPVHSINAPICLGVISRSSMYLVSMAAAVTCALRFAVSSLSRYLSSFDAHLWPNNRGRSGQCPNGEIAANALVTQRSSSSRDHKSSCFQWNTECFTPPKCCMTPRFFPLPGGHQHVLVFVVQKCSCSGVIMHVDCY